MTIEFTKDGRRVSKKAFFKGMLDDAIELGMRQLEESAHATASSIVDPETGKHAEVIVRRTGKESLQLLTNGSPAFARELERRLGIESGDVETTLNDSPTVYLAHASENKEELALPLAIKLIENGIKVWLDKWEIGPGDSLRQRMDEGLENCSHFIVLLTPESIDKNWVNAEIDAGFIRDVDGDSKFIGLRSGVAVDALTPLLKSRLCPEINLSDDGQFESLVKAIYGESDRPELGKRRERPHGLELWSQEAQELAKHLVTTSQRGRKFDPQTDVEECVSALDISTDDVRMGLLDLEDAGLIERSDSNRDHFYPLIGLFVEFDHYFLDFNNREDARTLAALVVKLNSEMVDTGDAKALVPDWSDRRFNSALNTLDELKAVKPIRYMGGNTFTYQSIHITDHTRRFVNRARSSDEASST